MRVIYWILTAPILAFIISFVTSNRDDILIYLLPLPFEITVPLAFVGLFFMIFGAVIGIIIIWINGIKSQIKLRMAATEINAANHKIAILTAKLTDAENSIKTNIPDNQSIIQSEKT